MPAELLDVPIDQVDFTIEHWVSKRMSTQIRNALRRAGIHTVGHLVQCTSLDLQRNVRGCGIVGLVIIDMALNKMGLSLKEDKEDGPD